MSIAVVRSLFAPGINSSNIDIIRLSIDEWLDVHTGHFWFRVSVLVISGWLFLDITGLLLGPVWSTGVIAMEICCRSWRNFVSRPEWSVENLSVIFPVRDLISSLLAFVWALGPVILWLIYPEYIAGSLLWLCSIILTTPWGQVPVPGSIIRPLILPVMLFIWLAFQSVSVHSDNIVAIVAILTLSNLLHAFRLQYARDRQRLLGITLLEEKNQALDAAGSETQQALEELEDMSAARNRFFSFIGHEIRTPMNGIINLADVLKQGSLAKREKGYADTIHEASTMIVRLLNDLLDLSKMGEGRMELDLRSFNLREMLENVKALWNITARNKNVHLRLEINENVPVCVVGDDHRLRQVLYNLVGNAIKYTEKGVVAVKVRQVGKTGPDCQVVFEVEDTGIGIAEDVLPRLFDPYEQAETSTSRQYGGTGLGLAIVKDIVELMGGQVSVTSIPGEGSLFRLEIPLGWQPEEVSGAGRDKLVQEKRLPVAGNTVPRREPYIRPGRGKDDPARLLVAEDVMMNRMVIEALLRRENLEFVFVDDGQAALDALEENAVSYDAVIMDINMPVMGGVEATRRIRRRGTDWAHIPAIGLTAEQRGAEWQEFIEAGMDTVTEKPLKQEQFQEALESLVPDFSARNRSV